MTGLFDDLLLESYTYPPGPAGTTPSHAHEEYQLCISDGPSSRYRYRGAWHLVPPGTVSVLMPGEVHLAVETEDRAETSGYEVLYANPGSVEEFAAELGTTRGAGTPYFADVVLPDRGLVTSFHQLHETIRDPSARLERDTAGLTLLARLISRHSDHPVDDRPPAGSRSAVQEVRSYLEDNFAANVSLDELARLVNLSPFHLARVFRREVGMPPHAFQLQLRLTRAKRLLLQGKPVSEVAIETGFFDLSHFTRHFKRHVGVSPGTYVPDIATRPTD